MKMQLDDNGKNLIKGNEGLRLFAYQDQAGVWTIGWGCIRYKNGAPVKKGDMLANVECAEDLFDMTLQQYVDAVNQGVKVVLSQPQFNALVDFSYNEGTGALAESTLLKKLNAGDYKGAAEQFLVWDEITVDGKKKVDEDLVARRKKEMQMFLGVTKPQ